MTYAIHEIAELVGRARPIYERLARGREHVAPHSAEPGADAVLERWCQTAAKGNWPRFEKRLLLDDVDVARVRDILQDDEPSAELPAWSDTLTRMLIAIGARSVNELPHRFVAIDRSLPFEDVFLPIVCYAREQVFARSGRSYAGLAGPAHAASERALLVSLVDLCGRTLMGEFAAFRAALGANAESKTTALYFAFVGELLVGGLAALFREYTVLGRLVAVVVDCWIDATSELITRLDADREAIRTTFGVAGDLGPVVSLVSHLSDPHDRRRFVTVLTFANGFTIVYKPRDLSLEHALHRLLDWLNDRGLAPRMKTLSALPRAHYGWVEFVEHRPCEPQDARAYFERMGTLLCLAYVLEGVDLHNENIIVSGEQPVVVDAEAFFYPKVRRPEDTKPGTQALAFAQEQVRSSVLKTGLLPETRLAAGGVTYDVSALGGGEQRKMPGRGAEWTDVNTDAMHYQMVPLTRDIATDTPAVSDHIDDLVRGFTQTYKFAIEHREEILADAGPLSRFLNLPVRFIARPTRVYAILLQNGTQPRYLRNGIERSIVFDALSVGVLLQSDGHLWPVVRAEHRALEQLDVPRFTATTDGTALSLSAHDSVPDFFAESGYSRVQARLRQLDSEDMHRQVTFIRGAFLSVNANQHDGGSLSGAGVAAADAGAELTPDLALAECSKIAELLDTLAIRSSDGTATWVGLSCVLQTRKSAVRLLDMGLYDGVGGIVLFLAAMAKVSGETRYRDLARAALAPLQFTLRDDDLRERACNRVGIGGGFGVGSIMYSLVVAADLLADAELIDDAARAAMFVTGARVDADEALDVVLGSAGALLGLLKLYDATADATVLERARACAKRILSRQIESGEARGGWALPGQPPLSGFSHGAAGIAYALVKLHAITDESDLLHAARAAVAFERTLFVPSAANWSRTNAPPDRLPASLRATWCQGAPGIVLSRLGMLDALGSAVVGEDLDAALETTACHPVNTIDHLCCGNLGRADALVVAGSRLDRPVLRHIALHRAGQVAARARRTGTWALPEDGGPYRHGFFQGRAGIGYTLLRFAYPGALPAVLMWQ